MSIKWTCRSNVVSIKRSVDKLGVDKTVVSINWLSINWVSIKRSVDKLGVDKTVVSINWLSINWVSIKRSVDKLGVDKPYQTLFYTLSVTSPPQPIYCNPQHDELTSSIPHFTRSHDL
jgi:hypothetical protein